LGSFLIALPPPPAGAGGAEPIVNSEPLMGGRVASGAWKGDVDCGAEVPFDWPNVKPPPGVPGAWGKLTLSLVAGEAG
jgi:hypothetical protein